MRSALLRMLAGATPPLTGGRSSPEWTLEAAVSEPMQPGLAMTGALATGAKMAELAVAHGAIYVFPLVFAVVCAHKLGPANYGVVSFYTALTSFLCMLIEFGFDSIGVREVHAIGRREDPEQVLWSVTLAKLVSCAVTAMVAIPVLLASRQPGETPMAWAMLAYLVAFALDANWYLRSLELTRSVMLVAGVSRLAGLVVLVTVVTEHAAMARAMWVYAFVVWANAAAGWLVMYKLHRVRHPRFDLPHLRSLFASGGAIVLGNLSGASLTSGGIAVLGVFADPLLTGAANMALRIRTAGQATLLPISQLGFVRLSAMVGRNRTGAVALGRRLFYAQMTVSAVVALGIIIEADRIAALAYGLPEAPPGAGMLVRILAVGIPANLAGTLFGLQCLTLFKHERAYVLILLAASAIFFGLLLSSIGSSSAGNYGWALVAAESWIVLSAGLYLRRIVRAP